MSAMLRSSDAFAAHGAWDPDIFTTWSSADVGPSSINGWIAADFQIRIHHKISPKIMDHQQKNTSYWVMKKAISLIYLFANDAGLAAEICLNSFGLTW